MFIMAKDPAFLFYYQDWLIGTYFLSRREKGAYMDLLCYQADKGPLNEATIKEILNSDFIEIWPKIKDKFIEKKGKFFNRRLQEEREKRRLYVESRRKNRSNISKTYDQHMEDENEDEIKSKDKKIKNDNNKMLFDEFRILYPGTKRGLDTEFDNFKKKTKDWHIVLPDLISHLKKQIDARDRTKKLYPDKFLPEWKHLQTYVNQRSWEEEITTPSSGYIRPTNVI